MRVIDEDRETLGVFQTFEALAMAQEREVDLILVVPDASPPVCRHAGGIARAGDRS